MKKIKNSASFLWSPTPEFLEKKLGDHGRFGMRFNLFAGFIAPGFWFVDLLTDPVGARHTIWLRLLFSCFFIPALAFRSGMGGRNLGLLSAGLALASEVVFLKILTYLGAGMSFGIAGFTFWMFMPLLTFQGFSLRLNLVYVFLAAALPHLAASLGMASDFPHVQYAAMLWPAAFISVAALYAFDLNYLYRFRSEKALELASNTDTMTGASTRQYFMPILHREMIRSRRLSHPLSLLMLDIDHFRKINDAYGHSIGDLVLCTFTEICTGVSREIDLVVRMDGGKFAVLLPDTPIEGALEVAERIRGMVERTPIRCMDGSLFHLTVSIGVADLDPADQSKEDLVMRADEGLQRAKKSGRNLVCVLEP